MATADTDTTGTLSDTDWDTFNNKQTLITWGDGLQYSAPTASLDLVASGGLKITTGELETDDANIDHDALSNFASNEHFLQTAITNVSTALATGLLKVTTSTGALSVVTDSSTDWDTAYTHVSNNGTDHSYIDQSVISGATPTFTGTNITGTNIKINIGDSMKDVSEIKINIGDSWKAVTEAKINIGDVWKDVFLNGN